MGVLRRAFGGFKETHLISYDSWKSKQFDNESLFSNIALCPILSTAYGLSISVAHDNIVKKPFCDIFEDRRNDEREDGKKRELGKDFGGFDYGSDWDAWK